MIRSETTQYNFSALLASASHPAAAAPAFVSLDEQGRSDHVVTFQRLHDVVGAVAGGLRAQGIDRGSRVVVFLPMGVELFVLLLAVMRIGAVAVVVEPWGGRRLIEHAAKLVDADGFVGTPRSLLLRASIPTLRRVPVAVGTGHRRIPGTTRFRDLLDTPRHQHVAEAVAMHGDDPAIVSFTSGSKGVTGATRTHAVLVAQQRAFARVLPDAEQARVWTNLPVVVLHNLGRGMATLLPPAGIGQDPMPDPKLLHQLVARSRATVLALSPAPLGQLVAAPGRAPLEGVEHVHTGGGPVTPDLLAAAKAVLPNARITAHYGAVEVQPIALATAEQVLARRDDVREHGGIYVGREVDDAEVRVVRIERGPIEIEPGGALADWEVAPGTPGEVLVTGDHVNRDYWRDPEAVRANKVVDEQGRTWHRTGDVGRRDPDGGLWLLGRRGTGFSIAGRRLWALEVETPITDLPEVARAAICMPKFTGSDREFKNASAVLAVEPAAGFDRREATDATVRALEHRGLAANIEVRSLARLPVDRRHGTNVDLAALQDKLKPENQDDY